MDELRSVFAQEAREQLAAMEEGLLRLERGESDPDLLNAIFRAAHTIKGAAGVAEVETIARFTHRLENALDRLRNGTLTVSDALVSSLLRGCDHIAALLASVEADAEPDAALLAAGEALSEDLRRLLEAGEGQNDGAPRTENAATDNAATTAADPPPATGRAVSEDSSGKGQATDTGAALAQAGGVVTLGEETSLSDCWHVSVRFGRDVLRHGMEPLAFLRYLGSLGHIVHLTTLIEAIPPAAEFDAEACYLGFEIALQTRATKEEIENVFAFCRDECELAVLPPHSKVREFIELIQRLPEEPMRLGEILVASGALTREALERGLRAQQQELQKAQETAQPAPRLGEILVEQKAVPPEVVEAAAAKQKQVAEKKAAEVRLIRVSADKLDRLIDFIGELVIAGASVSVAAQRSGQTQLVEAASVLSRLVEHIRDSALQLRMVQIGETFNRFHRVVRDTAKELGKEIELVISGAETELDKSMVEKIGDPLMHLVRNAIDHGIEPPNKREALGKPRKGRIELNAYHDSGSIVIEVVDDGRGIDAEKIRAKALERGLIQPGQNLSEQELINLIFEPGFSTAEQVSNLSGRGVGMDVVRKNVQALRGSVEVKTEPGAGSRFIIRLPLTLAIIDGFLTEVNGSAYVIPLDNVVECLELRQENTCGHVLNLRGEALPFVRLRELFAIEAERPARENVVVVKYAGQKAGIVVDRLLGEFQTVIKPLGNLFRFLRGISGSTILGSGEVALILDVSGLVARCVQSAEAHVRSPQSSGA